MPKLSAGLLLYRRVDDGSRSSSPTRAARSGPAATPARGRSPRARPNDDEADSSTPPRREFGEETGHDAARRPAIDLGEVRMRSGKVVHAWAVEGDLDPGPIRSMTVEVEWPPRSGRT